MEQGEATRNSYMGMWEAKGYIFELFLVWKLMQADCLCGKKEEEELGEEVPA